jgi:hypothetical protein
LQKRYGRLLHLLQAIDWALARRPHHFSNVTGEYYLLKTGELSNPAFPQLKIVYRISEEENTVVLLDIDD